MDMYDPNEFENGAKFDIKSCEFVVIIGEQETIMTRDQIIKANPRVLIEWYESQLRKKFIKK